MAIVTALYGHNSFETAYIVQDYPYGRLRCKMYFWLETHPKKGVRLVTQSENPKNGRMNKPHASTYSKITENLYLDENGHCKVATVTEYTDALQAFEFIKNFPENHNIEQFKLWCMAKYKYLSKCVEEKRSFISTNGREDTLSEHELERYSTEMKTWQKAYQLAAWKTCLPKTKNPEDTAEPELKKNEK